MEQSASELLRFKYVEYRGRPLSCIRQTQIYHSASGTHYAVLC